MCRRIIGSLIGFGVLVALSVPAYAAERNPIFGKAAVKINTEKENKAVSGKGYYANYYGYYGNYYNNLAGYWGNDGLYTGHYGSYYNAYSYANAAASNYFNAYYYAYYGQ